MEATNSSRMKNSCIASNDVCLACDRLSSTDILRIIAI